MKWKLVARMRTRRGAERGTRGGSLADTWIDIKIGPKRELRCSCVAGGQAVDLPHGVGNDSFGRPNGFRATGTCNHIEALYRGDVTEDKLTARDDEYLVAYTGGRPSRESRRFVKLTKLGETMFRWRWAQLALERST